MDDSGEKELTNIINEFFNHRGYEQCPHQIGVDILPAEEPIARCISEKNTLSKRLKNLVLNIVSLGLYHVFNYDDGLLIQPGVLGPLRITVRSSFLNLVKKREKIAYKFAEYYEKRTGYKVDVY